MGDGEFLAHLARDCQLILDVARAGDLDAAVPSCEPWSLRDLVAHTGDVHRWATTGVLTGVLADAPPAPTTDSALLDWFDDGAARLLAALRQTPPDRPPRQVRLGRLRRPAGQLVIATPQGAWWHLGHDDGPRVEIQAGAASLLQLLWRRRSLSDTAPTFALTGDPALAAGWFALPLTP